MSDSSANRVNLWLGSISIAIVVAMAAVLFTQVRFIDSQNHAMMMENQRLEVKIDQLKTALEREVSQIKAKLDAGLPLGHALRSKPLNVNDELKGPLTGALVRQVNDDRAHVRLNGLVGLIGLPPGVKNVDAFARMVVPAVTKALKKGPESRVLAIMVLKQYDRHAASAAPLIMETANTANWLEMMSSIGDARHLDPQCDYVPVLIRYVEQSEDDWRTTLVNLQHSFTDEEVLQAYEGALEQASDDELKRRYAGVMRYLKDKPPAGSAPLPARTVESYIEEGER